MTKEKKEKTIVLVMMLAIGLVAISHQTKSRAADAKPDARIGTLKGVAILNDAADAKQDAPIWSDTYKGLALSVTTSPEYKIGKPCKVVLSYKNVGTVPAELLQTDEFSDFRVVMYRADGTTLPKSETALGVESMTEKDRSMAPIIHCLLIKIKPAEETQEILNFGRWFKIDKAGTYNLVVMRKFYSWEDGFIISNATAIKVVEMTDADETPIDKLRRHKVAPPPPAPAPK